MEELLQIIHQNIGYAHWIIFGALLLAGLNIPVSEDAMLFVAALLATSHPDQFWQLFFAVYLGALLSDFICFGLGWFLGPHILELKPFRKQRKQINKVSAFYAKYGLGALFFGRFVPFGVRNALFLTAGIGRMKPIKFIAIDTLACTISCSFFFSLYYKYGSSVVEFVKQANFLIFGVVLIAVIFWLVKRRRAKKRSDLQQAETPKQQAESL